MSAALCGRSLPVFPLERTFAYFSYEGKVGRPGAKSFLVRNEPPRAAVPTTSHVTAHFAGTSWVDEYIDPYGESCRSGCRGRCTHRPNTEDEESRIVPTGGHSHGLWTAESGRNPKLQKSITTRQGGEPLAWSVIQSTSSISMGPVIKKVNWPLATSLSSSL